VHVALYAAYGFFAEEERSLDLPMPVWPNVEEVLLPLVDDLLPAGEP
jgi:hypothetical protein